MINAVKNHCISDAALIGDKLASSVTSDPLSEEATFTRSLD